MEDRSLILRGMRICRFCLESNGEMQDIYEQNDSAKHVPLPLQIMACVGIEVFSNDGMPQLICMNCKNQALHAYLFKTNCKEADDALKLFLATGTLVKPHLKKEIEMQYPRAIAKAHRGKTNVKKIRLDKSHNNEPEVITLNYSNAMEITEIQNDEGDDDHSQGHHHHESELGIDDETIGEDDDEDEDDDDDENMDSMDSNYKEDKLNPTLKVNQVETDCFPCNHCERSFPLKQLLDLHKTNHERERSFECEICKRKFFTKYDLGKHLVSHSGQKPFTCIVCHKSFARESLLHRHEKIHVDVPKYLCSQCDRTFLTREDLDAHSTKHKKVRPFTCKVCNKGFVFKQGLERHEMSHSSEKPHKCNYCEASFTSTIKLTRHITSHAGLRPYPCKICGRTFLLSHHLTRHMRSHYAAQTHRDVIIHQYKCDICSMAFKKIDSLINHSAIHSMVNLRCVICNTHFENAQSVKEHINTHLSGLPFPCDKCNYSFETQEQLEEHEVKHAEMEYEEQIEKEVVEEARKLQHHVAGSGVDDNNTQRGDTEEEEDEEDVQEAVLQQQQQHDEDEDDDDDEVAEYTITNDINNPEVIRRSTRTPKVKQFVDFLKDEIISENEEEENGQQEGGLEFGELQQPEQTGGSIKPIVRHEGTKVYKRKSGGGIGSVEKPKVAQILNNLDQFQQSTNLPTINIDNFNLSNSDLKALPTKKYVNMKIGDKTVRVQKLIVTKEEMKAMAKQGKIEIHGSTVVFKKTAPSLQVFNATNIMEEQHFRETTPNSQQQSRKVYQRRATICNEEEQQICENDNNTIAEFETLENVPVEEVSMTIE